MEDLIAKIPTRKKQTLAALCLAEFCAAKHIQHEAITNLTEHLLSVLVATDLPEWNSTTVELELKNPVRDSIRRVLPPGFSESLLYDLVNAVMEVGWTNMYTGPSKEPLEQLRKVFRILKTCQVSPPVLWNDFYLQGNENPDRTGWGGLLGPQEYEKILNIYREIVTRKR